MPQDRVDRIAYTCVIRPHWRSPAMASGSSRRGATTTGAVAAVPSDSACAVCHPRGRSPGTRKLASPTRTPSTSTDSTQ